MASAAEARKQKQLNECVLWAADKNNTEKLKYYLSEGARADKEDPYKRTCLIKTVQHGNIDSFEALIAHRASINKADVEGETALIHAAYKGHFDILCRLLELGANVNHTNNNGENAVTIASKYGHYDCVRRLVTVGGDYNLKSKFQKTPIDVALDSMGKAKRQKRDDLCMELEKIVELLNDPDGIEALRKQEKMFNLTPEEFRMCLDRSEYRDSGINVRVIGLNNESIMAVSRALLRQFEDHDDEIADGIKISDGYCDIDIDTGEWITHDKISERELIHRQIGEVVRNYVNTHDLEKENTRLTKNSRSFLFRDNTSFSLSPRHSLDVGRETSFSISPRRSPTFERETTFDTSPRPSINEEIDAMFCIEPRQSLINENDYPSNETPRPSLSAEITDNPLQLQRSPTSTSLYSLKTSRSAVSLSGMALLIEEQDNDEVASILSDHRPSSQFSLRHINLRKALKSAKGKAKRVIKSAKQRLRSNASESEIDDIKIKNRKKVYDTFESVKNTMQKDNSSLAAVSVCSISSRYEFCAVNRLLFSSSAIYVFVLDRGLDMNEQCEVALECGLTLTNREYLEFIVNTVTRCNKRQDGEKSHIIFVSLSNGNNNENSVSGENIYTSLSAFQQLESLHQYLTIDPNLEFTFEQLYTNEFSALTSHISTLSVEKIKCRPSLPSSWLAYRETMCLLKEEEVAITPEEELVTSCIDQTLAVTSVSKQDARLFLHNEISTGTLLGIKTNKLNYMLLDAQVLYKLVRFLKFTTVHVVHDEFDSALLLERLREMTTSSLMERSTKCFVHNADSLWKVATTMKFACTDSYKSNQTKTLELYMPFKITYSSPDGLVLQFHRLEHTATMRIKFQIRAEVPLIFNSLSCTFFALFPLKEIHSKPVKFKDLVAFNLDHYHCLALVSEIQQNAITVFITRNVIKESWVSKYDICNGVMCLIKNTLENFYQQTDKGVKEFSIEFDTCSLMPPCFVGCQDLEDSDTYTCPVHDINLDPREITNTWENRESQETLQVEECSQLCHGLNSMTLSEPLTDTDIGKVIRRMTPHSRKRLFLTLSTEYRWTNPNKSTLDFQLIVLLIKWREKQKNPKLEQLQKLLVRCGENSHILCKIFRDAEMPEIKNGNFEVKLSPLHVNQLAIRLVTKSHFLALELGFSYAEYKTLLRSHGDDRFIVTCDILALLNGRIIMDIIRLFRELGFDIECLEDVLSVLKKN